MSKCIGQEWKLQVMPADSAPLVVVATIDSKSPLFEVCGSLTKPQAELLIEVARQAYIAGQAAGPMETP